MDMSDEISRENSYISIFWDGILTDEKMTSIIRYFDELALGIEISIKEETSPRIMALLNHPGFVWRFLREENLNESKDSLCIKLKFLLKKLSTLEGTDKVGLLLSEKSNQAFHPSINMHQKVYSI